ncbi:MAG: methyltransferase domain-containing protein [Ferrovum sp.]|jgi:hypothetical protein|nr:methyltransferase domain-containing protein [Ferrovum sp.]NDU88299.1 class I SAM-dependent methyltransferase [Ferrovum sp.]
MSTTQIHTKFSYDAHARTCAPDDFLRQIRRTVHDEPISDMQLHMIMEAIRNGLQLQPDDALIELACGNGLLSVQLFDACRSYLGTDISDYLISVAKKHFERLPNHRFEVQSGIECVNRESQPEYFTRALCYAGFQYFGDQDILHILTTLYKRFTRLERIFLGNLPDRARIADFFTHRIPGEDELSDPGTALGAWRTREALAQLADAAGWQAVFSVMPPEFHAAHYRYDVTLTRQG